MGNLHLSTVHISLIARHYTFIDLLLTDIFQTTVGISILWTSSQLSLTLNLTELATCNRLKRRIVCTCVNQGGPYRNRY